jgi:RHS repeat-associated protein
MMDKCSIQDHFNFTGKERDEETGYGYFGARYMDHELMTMWLSVDPLADKYPSISPYSYCAWNPIKLVDPDGNEMFPTEKRARKAYEKAVRCFGDDRVGEIRNMGTVDHPNYGFFVYGKGKNKNSTRVSYNSHSKEFNVSADCPDKKITSGWGLMNYTMLRARKNKIEFQITFGLQFGTNIGKKGGVKLNLISVELLNGSIDFREGGNFSTVKENNANVSSSVSGRFMGFRAEAGVNYSGGDYIDKNSVNSYGAIGYKPLFAEGSKGEASIGVELSALLGIKISLITSKDY